MNESDGDNRLGGRVWVLNLDADEELASPVNYRTSQKLQQAMAPHVANLSQQLLRAGDFCLGIDHISQKGLPGEAFCPTPHALAQLAAVGAVLPKAPSLEVLRTVNSRIFCGALPGGLPHTRLATTIEDVTNHMLQRQLDSWQAGWRLKRLFGMAGRGQRVVRDKLDEKDIRWLVNSLSIGGSGGIWMEPNVHVLHEFALHGMLTVDGELTLGCLVAQRCDKTGAWISSIRVTEMELLRRVGPAMEAEATRVAQTLAKAGYFGPFGIDGFEYEGIAGPTLQPRSEINARYSMGFAVGFADDNAAFKTRARLSIE